VFPSLFNSSDKLIIVTKTTIATVPDSSSILYGLAPVINQATRTVVLSSFPGAASLAAQEYYAFRHNQFWRLMSGVLKTELTTMPYPQRLDTLLLHGVGLWDIYQQCQRVGSLDTAIRYAVLNDFAALRASFPLLTTIGFNGKVAAKVKNQFAEWGYQTIILPSSSPAHASLSVEVKLVEWRKLGREPDEAR
jgi:double-stranded uracil-DNA glycosylase